MLEVHIPITIVNDFTVYLFTLRRFVLLMSTNLKTSKSRGMRLRQIDHPAFNCSKSKIEISIDDF